MVQRQGKQSEEDDDDGAGDEGAQETSSIRDEPQAMHSPERPENAEPNTRTTSGWDGSHLFLRERDIAGWRTHLDWIESHGGIDRILPGHGAATDLRVLDAMRRYMDDFEAAVALGDRDAAIEAMRARHPDYALERLLREYSVPAYLPQE